MDKQEMEEFCKQHDYDIRKSHNARWIDQKCTPDVLWSVSDFIVDYVENGHDTFTVGDIWKSKYAEETIAETFSKPGTTEESAHSEYDKVFAQPMNLLCYAGILEDVSPTNRHKYMVKERDLLDYIARNDMCALRFLCCYIKDVLTDSGLIDVFNDFFTNQDKERFDILRNTFTQFYFDNTPVQNKRETTRILTKVLNPLAYSEGKKGTEGGHMSNHAITKSDMMYNRDNFRDVYRDKPKNVSRKDWLAMNPDIHRRDGYFKQVMASNKRQLREFNDKERGGISELTQFISKEKDLAPATQIHHIFPQNEFDEIKYYIENMIALTPNQHYGFAHPNNKTGVIDLEAQKTLLTAKTLSIQENLTSKTETKLYNFDDLLLVLAVGWNNEEVMDIEEDDYLDVLHTINYHYDHMDI